MTKMMSDLPQELVEEILFRVPVACMKEVRCTCKKWNTLSKHLGKTAVPKEGEILAIVLRSDFRVDLMSINIHNNLVPSIKTLAKLISLNDNSACIISQVWQCEGLLLYVTEHDYTKLVVFNPYTGQNRWICEDPISVHQEKHGYAWYCHALGYEESKSCRAHKILIFADGRPEERTVYTIYEFNSNSWRVLDVTRDWFIDYELKSVSMKGNTYWYARNKYIDADGPDFLICFDFTKERFGPRLPLPFESFNDTVTLSSFGEEQLAVLFQQFENVGMEIWVTTNIEPNLVSWSKFLAVDDMKPLYNGNFLIDKDKRALVIFDKDYSSSHDKAHIIGENGYFRTVDIGEVSYNYGFSYVPSSFFF